MRLVLETLRQITESARLDAFASAAVVTAVSELARHVWVHAGGGSVLIEELSDGGRQGVRATFEYAFPKRGGAAKTPGRGLSGSPRLVDSFQVEAHAGGVTSVRIEKWQTRGPGHD